MQTTETYYRINDPNERPLERLTPDGGYCAILRTIGCIGDSMSSGEFESEDAQGVKMYHDMFDFSWGQFLARDCGCTVYNFSRGGMTARTYLESFSHERNFWASDKLCRAYILALGVNDLNGGQTVGSIEDVDLSDWRNNADTFAGHYAAIVQRLREKTPDARFFFVTIPRTEKGSLFPLHTALLHELTKIIPHSYVIDLDRDAPAHDEAFRDAFYMGGHMNAAGYRLIARQIETYIDWIIRHNMDDFSGIGFVGTPYLDGRY